MPQCKLDYCREPALPTGKRYCAHHKAEYLRKQQEAVLRDRAAPKCSICEENPVFNSATICAGCQRELSEQNAEFAKWAQFEAANTVNDLKEWIKEYML